MVETVERQAIGISLNDLKELEKVIRGELKNLEALKIDVKGYDSLQVLIPIVNYETVRANGKEEYASDTWQFEGIEYGKHNRKRSNRSS